MDKGEEGRPGPTRAESSEVFNIVQLTQLSDGDSGVTRGNGGGPTRVTPSRE